MTDSVFVIAEAGVNHNGRPELAHALVETAREAGADAVKFQSFRAKDVVTAKALKAPYQVANMHAGGSQRDMLAKLELSRSLQLALAHHARSVGLEFMSTAFDLDSLDFLVEEAGVERLKIASSDLTNDPLILRAAQCHIPLLVSTGMATLPEVATAMDVVAFGLLGTELPRSTDEYADLRLSPDGREALQRLVTLMQCTSEYPTPSANVNLRSLSTLKESFSQRIGYSDHTLDSVSGVAAVALGATVIEKHFTLDRGLDGPDHAASMEPTQLSDYIHSLREAAICLGSAIKAPSPNERETATLVRRSVVASQEIHPGETLSLMNLTTKRPASGLPPSALWRLVGRTASRGYAPDEFISEDNLG